MRDQNDDRLNEARVAFFAFVSDSKSGRLTPKRWQKFHHGIRLLSIVSALETDEHVRKNVAVALSEASAAACQYAAGADTAAHNRAVQAWRIVRALCPLPAPTFEELRQARTMDS